ncbi:MAG: aminodeoxychorismate synthase component I [Oleispira sp.]
MSRVAKNNVSLYKISLLVSETSHAIHAINAEEESVGENKDTNRDRQFSFLCANPSQSKSFSCGEEVDRWKQSFLTDTGSVSKPSLRSSANSALTNGREVPLHSGWVGYFSYPQAQSTQAGVIAEFNYYPWSICFDHLNSCFYLLGEPDQAAIEAYEWLLAAQLNERASDSTALSPAPALKLELESESESASVTPSSFQAEPFIAKWSQQNYQQAFSKVQDYLIAGDCYQVNLTHPFISANYTGSPLDTLQPLFQALKPSFGCYFEGEHCELVSMSPERFISINSSGKLEAKPIKGTIKRSDDPVLDKELIKELLNSSKNQAENLMIVDLLRNDLSMSAQPGSVQVDKLFELESHPNVHHLVSTISAQLKLGVTHAEAIGNAFPGGSITGAPKKRAMEIINELEVQPRSLYCGSFGYFSDTGNTDFNILIRSLEFRDNTITCWGGGGITVDSDCNEEYEESLTKIRRIMETIEKI